MTLPAGSAVLAHMRSERRRLEESGAKPAAFVLGATAWYWANEEARESAGGVHLGDLVAFEGLPVLVLPYVNLGLVSCVPAGRGGWSSGQRG